MELEYDLSTLAETTKAGGRILFISSMNRKLEKNADETKHPSGNGMDALWSNDIFKVEYGYIDIESYQEPTILITKTMEFLFILFLICIGIVAFILWKKSKYREEMKLREGTIEENEDENFSPSTIK